MDRSIVPNDSLLHAWLDSMEITEVPVSYQIAVGLSVLGASLKRWVYFDQEKWKVYPNMSVLLVGPSGIGKDTIINAGAQCLETLAIVPEVGGRTIEGVMSQLLGVGDPACAYLLAQELTAFLGGKDYQKSMAQELTHLLSTGSAVNISTKSGGQSTIRNPTLTVFTGSTKEWLHSATPDGSLEGGLFPRFLIVCESKVSKHIPLVKYHTTHAQRHRAKLGEAAWMGGLHEIICRYANNTKEIFPLQEAQDLYEKWYIERLDLFSKAVQPYANRSRDQVLRLAMLMALTRFRPYIEEPDMVFGIKFMAYLAERIDEALCPPTIEAKIGLRILEMLPTTKAEVIRSFREFRLIDIENAFRWLSLSNRAVLGEDNKIWKKVEFLGPAGI
jgi:hypothetical protein